MSTRTASSSGRSAPRKRSGRGPSRGDVLRRRLLLLLVVLGASAAAMAALAPWADEAVQEVVTLPLRHEDVIRQQAADKDLDPALIAGVIFAESHFRDQTSHAAAEGGRAFTVADIPYPETRDYVGKVLDARTDYRREYGRELGVR